MIDLCPEDSVALFSRIEKLNTCIVVAHESFVQRIVDADQMSTMLLKEVRFLAVLDSDSVQTVSAAKMLRQGCRGILPRQFPPETLGAAISAIFRGELWAPRVLVSEVLANFVRAASLTTEHDLTRQEARIVELTSKGLKNAAIADQLFISVETVRWHKRRINRKLRSRVISRLPARVAAGPPQSHKAG